MLIDGLPAQTDRLTTYNWKANMTQNVYVFNYKPKIWVDCIGLERYISFKSLYFHLIINRKFFVDDKHEELLKNQYPPDKLEQTFKKTKWLKTHTPVGGMLWKNIVEFINRGSLLCT